MVKTLNHDRDRDQGRCLSGYRSTGSEKSAGGRGGMVCLAVGLLLRGMGRGIGLDLDGETKVEMLLGGDLAMRCEMEGVEGVEEGCMMARRGIGIPGL